MKFIDIQTGEEYIKSHKEELTVIDGVVYSSVPYIGEYRSFIVLEHVETELEKNEKFLKELLD